MSKETVALAMPSRGEMPTRCAMSIRDMVMWDRDYGGRWLHPENPFIDVVGTSQIVNSRNDLVHQFLANENGADWLLFIDDDQIYPTHTLEVLMASVDSTERRIVGLPVYRFTGKGDEVRVTHNVMDAHESGAFVEWPGELPENVVMQVAAVGTGCMIVHRSVFDEMRTASVEAGQGERWAWFRHIVYQPADMAEGEDLFFCRRAWNLEIPVWVNTGLMLRHVKTVVLDRMVAAGGITI